MESEIAQVRAVRQQQDPARVRAERDALRTQLQLMARIVQVLEIQDHRLKETSRNLREQLTDHVAVPDLTRRRRT